MIELTCPMEQSRRQRCKRARLRHRAPQAVRQSNPADSHAIPGAPTRSLFVPGGGAQGWRNCARPGVDPVPAPDLSTAKLWVSALGAIPCRLDTSARSCCPWRPRICRRAPNMVFLRHMPPAQVPVLKNFAFDLMPRSAFIAQVPAEPKRSTTHRDARRSGNPSGHCDPP